MTEKLEGGITGKGFVKGDPRINRRGRPKTFDALRTLAQAIAHEAAKIKGEPVTVDGKPISLSEAILRKWATSPDPRLQMKFIAVAFGEVPTEQDVRLEVDVRGLSDDELRAIVEDKG